MIVIAIIALAAVLTIVAAILGSKFWHWAHVLVVAALSFTTIGFSFLVAEVLDVRTRYLKRAEDAAVRLEAQEELNGAIVRGSRDAGIVNRLIGREVPIEPIGDENLRSPGLVDLRHDLRLQNRTLGRIWRDLQPLGRPDPQTFEVQVGSESEQPLGIEEGAILFLFEQGPANSANPQQGPQYLGEFRVLSAADQQLAISPVLALDGYEAQRLLASQGRWSLYETMPVDRHDMFAGFTNDELRGLLPAASVEDYLRDGTPWTVDDGEWVKEGRNARGEIVGVEDWTDETKFVYRRPLRDYAFLFNDLAKQRVELEAQGLALKEDIAKLKATLTRAEKLSRLREQEQRKLKTDLAGVQRDRKAVEAHLAAVEGQLARGRALLEKVVAANARLADQLAARQQELLGGMDLETSPPPARGAVDRDAL
ncbi:MAG: hypothetical protein AAGB00_07600 [Planctomycetota bacterium]